MLAWKDSTMETALTLCIIQALVAMHQSYFCNKHSCAFYIATVYLNMSRV